MPDDHEAIETEISENIQLLLNRLPEDLLSKQLIKAATKADEVDWETTIDQAVEARLEELKGSYSKEEETSSET